MSKVSIIRALGIVLLLIAIAVLLYMYFTPYAEFIAGLQEYFKAEKVDRYISKSKYEQGILLPALLCILSAALIIWAGKVSRQVKVNGFPLLNIGAFWRSLDPTIKTGFIIILLINLIIRLYHALSYPISYDEAWTYLHFSSKGFLTSLAYYPLPNNHILHSLFTNATYYLPFDQTLNLRLPAILINLIACMGLFFSFSKLLDTRTGLLSLLLFSGLFPVLYYGYNSRGYSLILLAIVICFYANIQLIRQKESRHKYIFYFVLGGIIGLFTMPSFLYAFMALAIFTIGYYVYRSEFEPLKNYLAGLLACGMSVLLLYSPAILVSGWKSLAGNEFVRPLEYSEVIARLSDHFTNTSGFLFQLPLWAVLTVSMGMLIFLFIKKCRWTELLLVFFILCFSPLILMLHSVIPFPRTWIWLIIPLLYLAGLLLNYIPKDRFKWPLVLIGIAVLAILSSIGAIKMIQKTEQFSHKAAVAAEYLMDMQAEQVYSLHPLIHINLKYLFDKNKRHIDVEKIKQLPSKPASTTARHNNAYLIADKAIIDKRLREVKSIDGEVYIYGMD